MPEDTVIRMDDNVENDNSPDSEEPPRHKAGFDFAADPNEALFFAPQIYIALGIMNFINLFTCIVVIMTPYLSTYGCSLWTILFNTIVLVSEPMGHWIHWIVQCIYWMCFPLVVLGAYIYILSNKLGYEMVLTARESRMLEISSPTTFFTMVHVYTWIMIFPSLINAGLVLRMTIFVVQNRGG